MTKSSEIVPCFEVGIGSAVIKAASTRPTPSFPGTMARKDETLVIADAIAKETQRGVDDVKQLKKFIKAKVSAKNNQIDVLKRQKEELELRNTQCLEENEALNEQSRDKDILIEELKSTNEELQGTVYDLRDELDDQSSEISLLEGKVGGLEASVEGMKNANNALNGKLREKDVLLEQLHEKVGKKDEQITNLETEKDCLKKQIKEFEITLKEKNDSIHALKIKKESLALKSGTLAAKLNTVESFLQQSNKEKDDLEKQLSGIAQTVPNSFKEFRNNVSSELDDLVRDSLWEDGEYVESEEVSVNNQKKRSASLGSHCPEDKRSTTKARIDKTLVNHIGGNKESSSNHIHSKMIPNESHLEKDGHFAEKRQSASCPEMEN